MGRVKDLLTMVMDENDWRFDPHSGEVVDSDGVIVTDYDIADHLADYGWEEPLNQIVAEGGAL